MVEKKIMTEKQLQVVSYLLTCNGINDWERNFLNSLLKYKTLSSKQYKTTKEIFSCWRLRASV